VRDGVKAERHGARSSISCAMPTRPQTARLRWSRSVLMGSGLAIRPLFAPILPAGERDALRATSWTLTDNGSLAWRTFAGDGHASRGAYRPRW
jgi:hypothetical protein